MKSVLAVVLGGGAGTRLFPLTEKRSKPAVPFGGKYRIIDVPLSNCLNSNINRIFILTQYNSASLNHHVTETYRFSIFSRGFVNILAAEQTLDDKEWFQGTADAVRQTLHHLEAYQFRHILILSGDQLYQMNLNDLVHAHRSAEADITVATTPVRAHDAPSFGIMQTDARGRIVRFVEKPPADRLAGLESETGAEMTGAGRNYLASMGMYVFERAALFSLLTSNPQLIDFGRDVIPFALDRHRVHAYAYDGYWTDIGTVASFFDANLELTDVLPRFNLYDAERPIYTHARMLPPTKLSGCRIESSVLGQGGVLEGCDVERSVIGVRAIIGRGSRLRDCVVMGADYYQMPDERERDESHGRPPVGIGRNVHLERVIVDKNARIGHDVSLRSTPDRRDEDGDGWYARDGVIVIPKDGIIAPGTRV